MLLTGSDKTPLYLVIALLYVEMVKFQLLSLMFISVDLQTISIAARLPLMTAFADLFEVVPPSRQYHRASGKRDRNPLWYIYYHRCANFIVLPERQVRDVFQNLRVMPDSESQSRVYFSAIDCFPHIISCAFLL